MILTYTFRSILAQRTSSLIAILILASSSAIGTVLFGLAEGLVSSARDAGDPSTAIVLTEGYSDENSIISKELLDRVKVLDGASQASPEIVVNIAFVRNDGNLDSIRVRGVEPAAFAVHPSVKITGRFPASSEAAAVIGRRQVGTRNGFVEGGTVQFGRFRWPVVGVLEAKDSPFESEIWCDRTFLKRLLKNDSDNAIYVRLPDPSFQERFAAQVAGRKDEHALAWSETAYYREQVKDLSIYFDAVYLILFVLIASMIFTSANTIYTSFLGRTRELATLMAIGFTRARVMWMMTVESLLLTGIGGCIGLLLATLAHGYEFPIDEMTLVYAVKITPRVLSVGVGFVVLTGLLASVAANLQILRVQILTSLRE
jgi:putative ABC transport system permease protein